MTYQLQTNVHHVKTRFITYGIASGHRILQLILHTNVYNGNVQRKQEMRERERERERAGEKEIACVCVCERV